MMSVEVKMMSSGAEGSGISAAIGELLASGKVLSDVQSFLAAAVNANDTFEMKAAADKLNIIFTNSTGTNQAITTADLPDLRRKFLEAYIANALHEKDLFKTPDIDGWFKDSPGLSWNYQQDNVANFLKDKNWLSINGLTHEAVRKIIGSIPKSEQDGLFDRLKNQSQEVLVAKAAADARIKAAADAKAIAQAQADAITWIVDQYKQGYLDEAAVIAFKDQAIAGNPDDIFDPNSINLFSVIPPAPSLPSAPLSSTAQCFIAFPQRRALLTTNQAAIDLQDAIKTVVQDPDPTIVHQQVMQKLKDGRIADAVWKKAFLDLVFPTNDAQLVGWAHNSLNHISPYEFIKNMGINENRAKTFTGDGSDIEALKRMRQLQKEMNDHLKSKPFVTNPTVPVPAPAIIPASTTPAPAGASVPPLKEALKLAETVAETTLAETTAKIRETPELTKIFDNFNGMLSDTNKDANKFFNAIEIKDEKRPNVITVTTKAKQEVTITHHHVEKVLDVEGSMQAVVDTVMSLYKLEFAEQKKINLGANGEVLIPKGSNFTFSVDIKDLDLRDSLGKKLELSMAQKIAGLLEKAFEADFKDSYVKDSVLKSIAEPTVTASLHSGPHMWRSSPRSTIDPTPSVGVDSDSSRTLSATS